MEHAEPPERLAEHAPPLQAELVADELGVIHDGIRPKAGKVLRLFRGGHLFEGRNGRRTAGPPLVQHQDPIIL